MADGKFEFSASVNSTSELLSTSKAIAVKQLSLISIVGVTISG
jgi:hypothetical protein